MDFFQEQTFAAFIAVVLTLILAKIVSFAISTSNNEGPVTREMRVKSPKARNKKVRFVDDDVLIKRVDLSEGIEPLNDGNPVGETIVEENEDSTEKTWFGTDVTFLENQKSSGTSGVKREFDYDDDDDDDDWEGIERSELEKVFAEAVNYLEYDYGGYSKLASDVQMELYGLHKVAVEGSCRETRPMALKLSARAKWNAWERLGSMSQVSAMEKYIKVLSDNIPDWMRDYASAGSPKSETIGQIPDPELESKSGHGESLFGDSS